MMDRIKYEIYSRLWCWWHMRLRKYFDGKQHLPYLLKSRPWWHMCCNGDCGGWRTNVCNHLEQGWRYTKYYSCEEVK